MGVSLDLWYSHPQEKTILYSDKERVLKAFYRPCLQAGSDWLYVFAPGLKNLLLWAHKEFPDFPIMVTENGKIT